MTIRVSNVVLDIEEDMALLPEKVASMLKVSKKDFKDFKILRESIDARRKSAIKFNYTVEVDCEQEARIVSRLNDNNVKLEEEKYAADFELGNKKMIYRPVIVGMGPAGMFAGLLMAKRGYRPIVIERGQKVEERSASVESFWKNGCLNTESNVQFGEGGAGTFSDGKLTTRIKDYRCDFVLEEFVKAGAPKEIIYSGKPHIGTDILREVVKNIREEIIKLGGEVRFNSKLEDVVAKDGKLVAIVVNGEEIPCDNMTVAVGHSARDTYEMLHKRGIFLSAKPFAIGVRAEHSQHMIDVNQYGKFATHPRLKAADYRMTHTSKKTGRPVYSFCMCPGGLVVASASEDGRLVTNGMSLYKRDGKNSNAAIVVGVTPEDFGSSSPLAGVEFQRHYERLAYELGGGSYVAPVQLVGDFLKDEVSKKLGSITPTYEPGYEFRDMRKCLPGYVIETLKDGFSNFDRKINGFADNNAVLTGIETRTSAPVRIERNEKLESVSVKGLYPCGEGAGFAGGIMSAAVDGLKVAESIMKEYHI